MTSTAATDYPTPFGRSYRFSPLTQRDDVEVFRDAVVTLPYSFYWSLIFGLTIMVHIMIVMYNVGFSGGDRIIFVYLFDLFFAVDWFLNLLLIYHPQKIYLIYARRRTSAMAVDFFSMLPLEIIHYKLELNRAIRIYRITSNFHGRKSRNIHWPVLQKVFELSIIIALTAFVGGLIIHALTCNHINDNVCSKLLLEFRSLGDYEYSSKSSWHWYLKSQYLLVTQLIRSGFPDIRVSNLIDVTIIVVFILVHVLFLVYRMMALTVAAFMELQRSRFVLSRFMSLLRATLQVHNTMNLLPLAVRFYRHMRERRVTEEEDDLKPLPASMQDELTLNIHWGIVRRSGILRVIDISARRNIALLVKTCYLPPGYVLVRKGEIYDKMIHIISGTILLMENDETSVAVFTDGTIFGCANLFYEYPSVFTIKCISYCELDYIDRKQFRKLFDANYKVREECTLALQERISDAREMQRTGELIRKRVSSTHISKMRAIRWLEHQFQTKDKKHTMRKESDLQSLIFTDKYIDELVFAPRTKYGKLTFSRHIKYSRIFLNMQNKLSALVIVAAAFLFPYFACLEQRISSYFYIYVVIQELSYFFDICISLLTVFHPNDKLDSSPLSVLKIRSKEFTFYVDIIAIFPVFALYYESKTIAHPLIALATCVHTLKIWKLVKYAQETYNEDIERVNGWWILKILMLIFYSIWIWSVIFYAITCTDEKCGLNGWPNYVETPLQSILLTAIGLMSICLTGVAFMEIIFKTQVENLLMMCALITYCAIFVYMFADITSCFVKQRSHIFHFISFRESIKRFMSLHHVTKDLRRRAMSCVESIGYFSNYELKAYTQMRLRYLPEFISREMFKTDIIDMLKKLSLLRHTNEVLIEELVNIVKIHILPPGEIIVNEGNFSTHLFIVKEGLCEYVDRSPRVLISKGDIFPLVEVLGHFPVLSTVRCLSLCRIIALDSFVFKEIVGKYSNLSKDIDDALSFLLNEDTLRKIEAELHSIECFPKMLIVPYFHTTQSSFLQPTQGPRQNSGLFFWIYTLLNYVILPHGNFMIYMEVTRICLSIISALVFPLRRLIGIFRFSYFFYYLLPLDIVAYVDIYLRLRHAYHDRSGILVTNRMKIICHYMTRSLITDVFACFPFDFLFGMFLHSKKLSWWQGLLYLNRTVQIYRISQIPSLLKKINNKSHLPLMLFFYTVVCLIMMSNLAAYLFVTACEINENEYTCHFFQLNLKDKDSPFRPVHTYSHYVLWFVSVLGNTGCHVKRSSETGAIATMLLSIFGFVLRLIIYCAFTSYFDFSEYYASRANHQHQTTLMTHFMNEGKLKMKTRKAVTDYYYAHWIRTNNTELVPLFKTLHPSLCVEILFSMFGERLRKCQVLSDLGDNAIRIILPIARFVHFLEKSRVCRVNDVLDETYVVINGSVLVEAADGEVISTYGVGMMFGNIEPVKWNRQSVTVKAANEVEVLVFQTTQFFQRLRIFPRFDDTMALYTRYHVDYIPPGLSLAEEYAQSSALLIYQQSQYLTQHIKWNSFLRNYLCVPYDPSQVVSKILCGISLSSTFLIYIVVLSEIGAPRVSVYSSALIYFFDFVHLCAIFYKLNCAFYDDLGKLVTDHRAIYQRYIRSYEFFYDVVSLLPLDVYFLLIHAEYITSIMRLNRCCRIIDIFTSLKITPNRFDMSFAIKSHTYTIVVIAAILLPLSSLYVVLNYKQGYHISLFLDGFYTSLHLFSMADLQCFDMDRDLQIAFLLFASQVAHALWILIIIRCCSITRAMYKSLDRYACRANEMYYYLKSRSVPADLLQCMWTYVRSLWHISEGYNEPQQVSNAPRLMRQAIKFKVYGPFIRKHGYYRHLHRDFLRQMIDKAERCLFFPGNVIAVAGIADHCTFFICWGRVDEIFEKEDLTQQRNRTLKDGDFFGIVQGVFPTTAHHYTYRATTKCEILILKYDDWCYLLDFFPATKHEMYHSANSMYIFSVP